MRVYTDVFEHDGATYTVCASGPGKDLYLSIWKRIGNDNCQVHLSFAKTRRTLMSRLAKYKGEATLLPLSFGAIVLGVQFVRLSHVLIGTIR